MNKWVSTHKMTVSTLDGILFCIVELEWLKTGISRKITLRPEELQGLVHLMLSTSSASNAIVTAITSSEIAVVEKLLDNY